MYFNVHHFHPTFSEEPLRARFPAIVLFDDEITQLWV